MFTFKKNILCVLDNLTVGRWPAVAQMEARFNNYRLRVCTLTTSAGALMIRMILYICTSMIARDLVYAAATLTYYK